MNAFAAIVHSLLRQAWPRDFTISQRTAMSNAG
jgi:hypothetical protein